MALINDHYLKLKAGYLFPEIARRVNAFTDANPDARVIRLGIGDVTEPLVPAVIEALHKAVDEMADRDAFRGYGPEQGYDFLRKAIAEHDFAQRGCDISADEVFVSDGSKCDTGNVLDILGPGVGGSAGGNVIAVCDPVYPVYVDTNVMAGNTGAAGADGRYEGLVYLPMTEANDFNPAMPDRPVDVIYLCYPNNPTGAVASRETLKAWVDHAREHGSLILFDAAYEAYITDDEIPHSIYEIEGAREVAMEFRSYSKTAGFTGLRCAYTIVPHDLKGRTRDGETVDLHRLWNRRQSTKFNGVSYIVQRGAEAVYSSAGLRQVGERVDFYMENARLVRETLSEIGLVCYGGEHAPYIWLKAPEGVDSWGLFDKLLHEAHVVGTPGSGFGAAGEGYFRISAFNSRANVEEAMSRLRKNLSV